MDISRGWSTSPFLLIIFPHLVIFFSFIFSPAIFAVDIQARPLALDLFSEPFISKLLLGTYTDGCDIIPHPLGAENLMGRGTKQWIKDYLKHCRGPQMKQPTCGRLSEEEHLNSFRPY